MKRAIRVLVAVVAAAAGLAAASAAPKPDVREFVNPRDGYELVFIPSGESWMGSRDGKGYEDEHPRHKVRLDGYYIGEYEVTVGQYEKFCAQTGRRMPKQPKGSGEDHPVVNVTWRDAEDYAKWAGMRLPTEAEWEKAARGGSDTAYWWGDTPDRDKANYLAGKGGASGGPTPADKYPPNRYGLHDVCGNVWDWCADWYREDYYAKSPAANPRGPASGEARVIRGGAWNYGEEFMRVSNRAGRQPDTRFDSVGFRCAK